MIRVLIADDHHVVRRGIRQLLENYNDFEVSSEAGNGHEALHMLDSGHQTDVLLADIGMLGMDGLELAENVRKRHPQVKVVLLTMQEEDEYIHKAFGAGVNNYLFKTADVEEVVFGIKQAMYGKPYICSGLISRMIERAAKGNMTHVNGYPNVQFSRREKEVLELIADGYTNEEAADKLFTSRRTVEGHRQTMIDKTGCKNSLALVKFAMQHGIIG